MTLIPFLKLFIIYSILHLSNSEHQYYRIPPYDISAFIGTNVTIPCVVATPHGDVQWTKDGLALGYDRQLSAFPSWSIIGDENLGEFNFFIQSLKVDDEGIYACEVSPYNNAPSLKQIAHVNVLVQPHRIQIYDQFSSNESEIITMRSDEKLHHVHCRVDGARPAATIRWLDENGVDHPAISRTFLKNYLFTTVSTLSLTSLASLNRRRFTCEVHHETLINMTSKLRSTFEIRITSPPSTPVIAMYPPIQRFVDGSFVNLSCQSYGGYPLGKLVWYRLENRSKKLNLINNSSMIYREENRTDNNISLIVKPSDNNAILACHVMNDYLHLLGQKSQSNITLQVAFGPSSVNILDINASVTTLIEGNPRRFLCQTSSSNPRPVIVWKINGQIVTPDMEPLEEHGEFGGTAVQLSKTIGLDKSLRHYHKKLLLCEARNPDTGHTLIASTELNIIYDAVSIEIYGIGSEKLIRAGDRVTAECILIGGNPLGRIVWYKGDHLIHSEYFIETEEKYVTSRIEFIALPSDNNVPLTCKGQVENFPARIASFILNIAFPPTEISIVESALLANLSLDHNDDDEFECRTSMSNPQADLRVSRQSRDGQRHLDLQYTKSSSYVGGINSIKFKLPRIDLSLHGSLLICEAILNIDIPPVTRQVTYVLHVNHKPYFNDFNRTVEVNENQAFNISFQAHAFPMPIIYTWFHPLGRQLMNDQMNIFINDGQLSLRNIRRNDLGTYRCVAANPIGYTEVNFNINVLYGPVITRAQGYSISKALMPGSAAILLCAVDGNPINLNHVRWFKDKQEISYDLWEKRFERNEATLIRNSVQREDAGQYACEVDNPYGNSHATLPLTVQYAPEIDRSDPSRHKVAVDSDRFLTAKLHCHFSAIPKATVIWMKDNRLLPMFSKYQSALNEKNSSSSTALLFDAILYVVNVTKSDHGIYQCKVENKLGIDLTEILLTGLTIPDPPSHMKIVNVSYSSLTISWVPGFDGGARQNFQIRYRRSTDTRYTYTYAPEGAQSFVLKNLKSGNVYHLSIRSNNSYYLSEWTDEMTVSTSRYISLLKLNLYDSSSRNIPLMLILLIAIIGFLILLINIIVLVIFIVKRRRANTTSENSSTIGTNETEANTIDIFQPIPSNFFLTTTNTYKKYDDDDLKRPFVSSYSSVNLQCSKNSPCYATPRKNNYATYSNVRIQHYYPSVIDNNSVGYRNFRNGTSSSTDTNETIQAELV